jgi:hypothetical protein
MGGRTLDQFNSRQQARSKKMTNGKEVNSREQEAPQTNQNDHKAK